MLITGAAEQGEERAYTRIEEQQEEERGHLKSLTDAATVRKLLKEEWNPSHVQAASDSQMPRWQKQVLFSAHVLECSFLYVKPQKSRIDRTKRCSKMKCLCRR